MTVSSLTAENFRNLPDVIKALTEPRRPKSVINYMCGCDINNPNDRKSLFYDETVEPLLGIWFRSGTALDHICKPFSSVIRELKADPQTLVEDPWLTIEGQVAKVILADQLSRSCFRGTAEAFSFDCIGRELVRDLVSEEKVEQTLKITNKRPIVVGGTGLYFLALTKGLAQIPEIPTEIRKAGDELRIKNGNTGFTLALSHNDPKTLAKLDQNNSVRLQRAWEVWTATGRGLSDWQEETSPPLVNPINAVKITLTTERDWLTERIEQRFNKMMEIGALDEVRNYFNDGWDPTLPSAKAIGAQELVAYLNGTLDINSAISQAKAQTRKYAKRQRTWFRSKMADWHQITSSDSLSSVELLKTVSNFP